MTGVARACMMDEDATLFFEFSTSRGDTYSFVGQTRKTH